MESEPIRAWLRLKAEVEKKDGDLKKIKKALADAEKEALDVFEREGVASVRLDGKTVSLKRELHAYVKVARHEQLLDVLDECGLSDLARRSVNMSTLSAHVREQEKLGVPLPEALLEIVDVTELFKLSAVRSTRGS